MTTTHKFPSLEHDVKELGVVSLLANNQLALYFLLEAVVGYNCLPTFHEWET